MNRIIGASFAIILVPCYAFGQMPAGLVDENGVVDHSLLNIFSLQAFEALFDRYGETPGNTCRGAVEAAEAALVQQNVTNGVEQDLSFDQQLEIESIRQSCVSEIEAASAELASALDRSGQYPRIILEGFSVAISHEAIEQTHSGSSFMQLHLCGLPSYIWFDQKYRVEIIYPTIGMGEFDFRPTRVEELCVDHPGVTSNWSSIFGATLYRSLGLELDFRNIEEGMEFRSYLLDAQLRATVECRLAYWNQDWGGINVACIMTKMGVHGRDGALAFELEGSDRTWRGSAPISRYFE